MTDRDTLFDVALSRADDAIRTTMGTEAEVTSGARAGSLLAGVFDDPDNISFAGQGVRLEGTSPTLFVKTSDADGLRRADALLIGGRPFWIDRIGPDDGGSCHLWLGTGTPPAGNRHR